VSAGDHGVLAEQGEAEHEQQVVASGEGRGMVGRQDRS
jgi:hypothetical protein